MICVFSTAVCVPEQRRLGILIREARQEKEKSRHESKSHRFATVKVRELPEIDLQRGKKRVSALSL
jgi:hypothetical protein